MQLIISALDALVVRQDAARALELFEACAGCAAFRPLIHLNTLLCKHMLDPQDGHRAWRLAGEAMALAQAHPWYVPAYNLAALMYSADACEAVYPGASTLAASALERAAAAGLHPQTFLLASANHMKANRCAEATAMYARAATLGGTATPTDHVVRAYADTGDGALHVLHRGAATLLDTLYGADINAAALLALHAACFQHLSVPPRGPATRSSRIAFVSEHLAPGSIMSNAEPFMRRMTDSVVVAVGLREHAPQFTRDMRTQGRLLPDDDPHALAKAGVGIVVCLDGCTGTLSALDYIAKSAPPGAVVVSAIGYAHPTCHPSVHYRLTDSVADPVSDVRATTPQETPLRMDPCFLCWQPPIVQVPLRALVHREGFVANHNFRKLSPPTLALYATVLEACPGATLTLKPTTPITARQKRWIRTDARLASLADAGRVSIEDAIPDQAAYYAFLSRFRVCLDCFPYNGTVTTLEALWSDIPVVTLTGNCHRARVSTSILHAIGRSEWCAAAPDDYVRIARDLFASPPQQHIGAVREQLRRSPIMDHDAYAHRLRSTLTPLVDVAAK